MTEHLTFHLVSPEKKLASLEAQTVGIPGIEGDITLLPNHADFLTTLRPGIIKIEAIAGEQDFVVTGGFVEVSGSVVTVLAEKAVLKVDANKNLFELAVSNKMVRTHLFDSITFQKNLPKGNSC